MGRGRRAAAAFLGVALLAAAPAGLSFAAATRTVSGTPTAAQGATTYTLAATDADGDKGTLRFSIEIEEIAVSISSPSVAEGATGATATLEYAVTLNRAPGRQVTVRGRRAPAISWSYSGSRRSLMVMPRPLATSEFLRHNAARPNAAIVMATRLSNGSGSF